MKNLFIKNDVVGWSQTNSLTKRQVISIFDIVFIELRLNMVECRYKNKFGLNNIVIYEDNYLCMSGADMVFYYFGNIDIWEMCFKDTLTAAKFYDKISKIFLWELLKQ